MFRRVRFLSEARQVVRPVLICLAAMGIAGYAMAVKGPHQAGVLGGAVVLIAAYMVFQVRCAVTHLHRESESARKAAIEAEKHYLDVLRRIMKLVEAREPYADRHSERVGRLAKQLGAELGLKDEKLGMLALAGELHDIGLLAIPEGILNKHSRLGAAEFRTLQTHSEVSYEILKPLTLFAEMLPAVRYHHERMNGTGYPSGIRGEEVPIEARILAVANDYDAMTHDRPYRRAMTLPEAVRELRRCTPHGYDQSCVEALAKILHVGDLEEMSAPQPQRATA